MVGHVIRAAFLLLLASVACGRTPTAPPAGYCGPALIYVPMRDHTTGRTWVDTVQTVQCRVGGP